MLIVPCGRAGILVRANDVFDFQLMINVIIDGCGDALSRPIGPLQEIAIRFIVLAMNEFLVPPF